MFMKNSITNGYAEKAPSTEADTKRKKWYISHHGVYPPKKLDKIQVVFDCSTEFKNKSINQYLLQGLDLTNNLVGVLCIFRKEPVSFMCDIEAMFHQVTVSEKDKNLLRFLWWEDRETSQDPVEFRMTVHLFGATSSPGSSNYALKECTDDNEKDLGSTAANFDHNDFYVDDGLKSAMQWPLLMMQRKYAEEKVSSYTKLLRITRSHRKDTY